MDASETMIRPCCACNQGEQGNYTDEVNFRTVREPETGKFILRGYLCSDHESMYLDDGYLVT